MGKKRWKRVPVKRRRKKRPGTTHNTKAPWFRPYLRETTWATSYDVTTRLINEMALGRGVELGTGYGWHAEQILLRCPTASVITVDAYREEVDNMIKIWNNGQYDRLYQETIDRLRPYGKRACPMRMTTLAAAHLVTQPFDWLYVDAGHDYDSCMADLRIWAPRTTRLLMGHDYGHSEHVGVKKAVDEYLAEHDLTLDGVEETVWWVKL